MRIDRTIIAAACVVGLFVFGSCAEQKVDDLANLGRESLAAWIKKNDPAAELKPSGIYIRFVDRNASWDTMSAPKLGVSWLRLNYTGRTLSNNVIETRDSVLARLIGTWAVTTHFCDDYILYARSQKLCAGFLDALFYLRPGDSARIYIPSGLGYSSSMTSNEGYGGVSKSYFGYPVFFDVRLRSIINDPYEAELAQLAKYALDNWGVQPTDTLSKGLYMRIVKDNPTGDTITEDSTVRYYFANYFFDGQLVATNNDSVARKYLYYSESVKYTPGEILPTTFKNKEGTFRVYPKVALKMRRGERAEVLATSWWGPGTYGDLTLKPAILPYEPLRYDIHILTKDTTTKK